MDVISGLQKAYLIGEIASIPAWEKYAQSQNDNGKKRRKSMKTSKGGLCDEGFNEVGAVLKALEDAGAKKEHLKLIRNNKDVAKSIVEILSNAYKKSDTPKKIGSELAGDE